jgi:hypothetical protein
MTKKRSAGEGTISQLPSGSWCIGGSSGTGRRRHNGGRLWGGSNHPRIYLRNNYSLFNDAGNFDILCYYPGDFYGLDYWSV